MAPQVLYFAIPGIILLIALEGVLLYWHNKEHYDVKDTAASLSMGLGDVIINFVLAAATFGLDMLVYQFRFFDIGFVWWAWILVFFAEDISYYWFHRASHRSRYLWASHVIHHSSQKFNLSTGVRQNWTHTLSGAFVFWLWIPLLGFHPVMLHTVKSFNMIYQFIIHTETVKKLPRPIEWFFNTPSHHRVHHGSDDKYLDKNYAGVLIIWDRLFGTFQREEERPTYGITHNIDTYNPVRIAFHEWGNLFRDASQPVSWKERLRYIFAPPGWRPPPSASLPNPDETTLRKSDTKEPIEPPQEPSLQD